MSKIVIEGVGPGYDGEHDIDFTKLTNRDYRTVKRVSGLRAGEFENAIVTRDLDLVVGLAIVAFAHEGKVCDEDVLLDAKAGTVRLLIGDEVVEEAGEAGEEIPPQQEPAATSDGHESKPTSGETSTPHSGSLVSLPSPTGPHGSATGAGSDPATLAI